MPILSSAIIGLLIPEATKLIGSWLQEKKDKAEHLRKVEMLTLAHNNKIDLADVAAFNKAQMDLSSGMAYPPNSNGWQTWTVLMVNASIHAVRPLLTGCALAMLVYILMTTVGVKRDELLDEIVLTCVAIMRYWFGYREDLRLKGKK